MGSARGSGLSVGLFGWALVTAAPAQVFERASVTSTGGEPNGSCFLPEISADGSVVAFTSLATNLVPGDTNGVLDVFVRDRVAQSTTRVSVGNAGQQSTATPVSRPYLSGDGRWVLFESSGLDPADTDPGPDVYLRDRASATTTLLSLSTVHTHHRAFGISSDGRVVAFEGSSATSPSELRVIDRTSGVVRSLVGGSTTPGVQDVILSGGALSGDGRWFDFKREVLFTNGDFTGTLERLDVASGALTVLATDVYFELPMQSSFDGRYLLFNEYGLPFLSGSTALFRLDTLTGERLRLDVRVLPPPPFGTTGFGVLSGALSSDGSVAALASDDTGLIPGGDPNFLPNAYVRIPAQHGALRLDLDPQGLEPGAETSWISITGDGSRVAFASWADTLVPGDTNQAQDVFVRVVCGQHHPDLDLDGFGASGSASVRQCVPAPAGWSVSAIDCDDGAANVHPFAFDGCDGLDNDCDGATDEASLGETYCAPNFSGDLACGTTIGASGCLTLSSTSGYVITASNLPSQRPGLFFYGLHSNWASWGGAGNILCVHGPRQRLPISATGGSGTCGGSLSIDLAAWLTAHPTALGAPFTGGEQLYIQGWYRDIAAPLGTSLTSAWTVAVSP